MNETISTAGAWRPTPATATMKPSVAARLYAGAVDAIAMTRFEMYPSASGFRPLLPGTVVSRTVGDWGGTVVDSKAGKTYAEGRTAASRTASECTAVFIRNVQRDRLYGAFLMGQGEISVAVLGAGGTIAPAIVADLAQSDEVQSMNLLDLDQSRAQAVADAHGGGKASAMEVDARTIDDLASA